MMSKYKIREYRSGFKVYELRNIGGWAWMDTGRVFETKEKAEQFVEKKRGEKNDSE